MEDLIALFQAAEDGDGVLDRRFGDEDGLEAAREGGVAVTDESMAMESQGLRPLLVEGREDNLKITTAADLDLFAFLLARRGAGG